MKDRNPLLKGSCQQCCSHECFWRRNSRLTEGLWVVKFKKISLSPITFFFYRKDLLSSLVSPVTKQDYLLYFFFFFSFHPPAGSCKRSSGTCFQAACWNQYQRSPLWDEMHGKACLVVMFHILPFCYYCLQQCGVFVIIIFLTYIIIPNWGCIACSLSSWYSRLWGVGSPEFYPSNLLHFLLSSKDGKRKLVLPDGLLLLFSHLKERMKKKA